MTNPKEINIEPIKADAELMSAWLGGVDDVFMDSKLLFDLQTLLRHYADFLVPNIDVSVDYKAEGVPCASVDKNQVWIPLDSLQEGKVDCTIASVIHELHHIKYSDRESVICRCIFPYFQKILSTVEVTYHGKVMSIFDALISHGDINSQTIVERNLVHTHAAFIYQYFGDLFLLLNAIEDVRIDEMQPQNLKKYRFKQEKECFAKFEEGFKTGKIDKDSLFGKFIDTLFHLKGLGHSDFIANSVLSKESICGVEIPSEFYPPVFSTFAKVLQEHAGSLWEKYQEEGDCEDSPCTDFLIEEYANQEGNSESVKGNEELELDPKKSSDCKEIDAEFDDSVRHNFGEEDIADLLNSMADETGAKKDNQEVIMNPQLWAEIQAFKALQHIPCREVTIQKPNGVNYDTLILDCYA